MKKLIGFVVVILAVLIGYLYQQKEAKPTVIGVLQFTKTHSETLQGFKDGLKVFGYEEGKQVKFVFDGPAPAREDLPVFMEKLLKRKPDIIFTSTTPAARMAKKMTADSKIPVVFAPVNDPVFAGVVLNIKQPEGNVTGVRLMPSDGKRLEALLELSPTIKKVFVPYNPEDKSAAATLDQLEKAVQRLDVVLVTREFFKEDDVIKDKDLIPADVQAIFMPREGLVLSRNKDFVQVSNERGLVLSTPRLDQVKQGATIGYGFIGYEIGKQAARLAKNIMMGTPVSKLPVETAQDYLYLNMQSAKKIQLNIPEHVLRRAHFILR